MLEGCPSYDFNGFAHSAIFSECSLLVFLFVSNEQGESIYDRERQIASRTMVLPPWEGDRFLCGFSHIFAGGYSAGYFSYK
jgi:Zn-dependent oligopeptidase